MPNPWQWLLLLEEERGIFPDKRRQILSDHAKKNPGAKGGNIGRVM
jgi:hypothetical protein